MEVRRPRLAELGLFLLVVALPLVFTPFSASPFGDPKLVVLVAGCLALVASGLPADRLTVLVGGALILATLFAALLGVDAIEGLTAQTTSTGSGLITMGCVVVVASLGATIPTELRLRGMRWFVGAGVAVAAIGIAFRSFPHQFEALFPDKGMIGSTLGNQIFAIAFVAAVLGALLAIDRPQVSGWWWVGLTVLALGLASFSQRSGAMLAIAAGVIAWWRLPGSRRRTAKAFALIIVLFIAWQAVTPFLPISGRLGAQLASLSNDRARLVTWKVGILSAIDRPILGWGPGSTHGAYVATASEGDLEVTGRAVGDAHNLFVTSLIELGAIGLVLILLLVGLLAKRALPRSAARAPAFTAGAVLALSAMIEPINLVVTPLLFLFLALAGPPSDDILAARLPNTVRRLGRAAMIAALALASVVSLLMLTASTLERWGRVYGETWALEAALQVQPWRLSSTERLALIWALDGRAGDEAAGERARDLMTEAVADHPWDADVRLWAADIETLLGNEDAARAWVEEHLERFPADVAGVREAGSAGSENTLPGA